MTPLRGWCWPISGWRSPRSRVGSMMAVMQAVARAGVQLPFGSARMYYLSVTAHGVLVALVFTTFFIMALGYLVAETTLGRIAGQAWAWAGVLGRAGRHPDDDAGDPVGDEHRALHLLSAAAGASGVLRRRHTAGGGIVDLVRRDDRQLSRLAAVARRRAHAAGDARHDDDGHHLDPGDRRPGRRSAWS